MALICTLAPACSTSGSSATTAVEIERVATGSSMVVHRVYSAAFQALEDALDSEDLAVAKGTLRRLQGRLQADRASAPTMAAARLRDDDVAARTVSGELPSAESVAAASKMAAGFERVIEGRLRMAATAFSVELRRKVGQEAVEVSLVADSEWPGALTVEPGAGRLEVLRTSLEPRTGSERREARITALEGGIELQVGRTGSGRVVVATLPVEVPIGVIATRMEVNVSFNGGTVRDGDRELPMREIQAGPAKRTDFPVNIPLGLVEPLELVELVERGNAPLPALLERAVRIAPARHDEALDRLGKSAITLPVSAFRTAIPAVRWIVGTNQFGRDEERWRTWLIERYEQRVAEGRAVGG